MSGSSRFHQVPSKQVTGLPFGKNCPCCSRQLVGQRCNNHTVGPALQQPLYPATAIASGNDCADSVHQHGAHIRVTPFGDSQLPNLATGARLAGCQAQPGRKLPARIKAAQIRGSGYQRRRCQGANAGDRLQSLHLLVLLDQRCQPFIQLIDVFLQAIDAFKLVLHTNHQHRGQPRLLLCFAQLVLNALQQKTMTFRQGYPKLVQQATQRIGLHDPHLHELGANAVQSQAGLLLLTLDRHGLEPAGKTGRLPFLTVVMLQMNMMQQFFVHSDRGMKEALHDIPRPLHNFPDERRM